MHKLIAILLTLLALAGAYSCTDTDTLPLAMEIVTPVDKDAFEGVARLKIIVTDFTNEDRTSVYPFKPADGFADLSFELKDLDRFEHFTVEILGEDAEERLVSRGRSSVIDSLSESEQEFSVYFAPIGQLSMPPVNLVHPRLGAKVAVPGENDALIIGGAGANMEGEVLDSIAQVENFSALFYKVEELEVEEEPFKLEEGLIHHSVTALDAFNVLVLGGYSKIGEQLTYMPEPLVISASETDLVQETVAGDFDTERIGHAASKIPGAAQVFISGGLDASGNILDDAGIYTAGDRKTEKLLTLKSARHDHTQSVVIDELAEFVGVLIYGGNSDASQPAEWWAADAGKSIALQLQDDEIRTGHAAATLSDRRAIIVGGNIDGQLTASAVIFRESCMNSDCEALHLIDDFLKTPRKGHSVTLAEYDKLVVCGGVDAEGLAIGDCEIFKVGEDIDIKAYAIIEMAHPRAYHAAALMPDGTVALVGGWNEQAGALDSVEIYMPE